jgi:hypothetical protein
MKFSHNGAEVKVNPLLSLPDRVHRLLEMSADGELFTSREICVKVPVSLDRLSHTSCNPKLIPHTLRHPGRPLWWGSEKTIAAAKKELAQ